MKPAILIINKTVECRYLCEAVKRRIRKLLTFKNPVYLEAVKRGRYIAPDLTPELLYYEELDNVIYTPKGFTTTLEGILQEVGQEYQIKLNIAKRLPINISFNGKLRDYQQAAQDDMLKSPYGFLEAKAASGKTCMACSIIAKRKVSTLIIVHSKELLYQWQDAIKQWLKYDCGLIGDGKFQIKEITVGIVNTVSNNTKKVQDHFNQIVFDEAHRLLSDTWLKVAFNMRARYHLGLSVSKDTVVVVKQHNTIRTETIETLFDNTTDTYIPDDMYVRSCSVDGQFGWGKVTNFIRHKLSDKRMYRITTTKGRSIDMTEDHSAMIVKQRKLQEAKPAELQVGDSFLVDPAAFVSAGNDIINFTTHTLDSNRPKKQKIHQIDTNGSVVKISKIEMISYDPNDYVYDFSVEGTETFVGNGIVCHNSATPYRRDGLTQPLFYMAGPKLHIADAAEIEDTGAVMIPNIVLIKSNFRCSPRIEYTKVIKQLVEDAERNTLIFKTIMRDLNKHKGQLLFVSDRVSHGTAMCAVLQKRGVTAAVLSSKTNTTQRKKIVQQVKAGKIQVLCSSVALVGEGFNCPNLSAIVLGSPIKFKGRVIQTVSRILRPSDGAAPRIYDVRDENVKTLQYSGFARNKLYKELGWWK